MQSSQDPLLFAKHHSKAFENSGTTLRTLYYPALVDVSPKEQQVRCGEHSDYGGITLLFQERPGLEVNQFTHPHILYGIFCLFHCAHNDTNDNTWIVFCALIIRININNTKTYKAP